MELSGIDRLNFSVATQPLAEALLHRQIRGLKKIVWTNDDPDDLKNLDIDRGIDLIATLCNGQCITIAVKVLTKNYKTITIEGNGVDKNGYPKQGDWSTCQSQMTLIIYSLDGETINRWAILDNARLALATAEHQIVWRSKMNQFPAQSEFRYTPFEEVLEAAPAAIYKFGGDWGLESSKPLATAILRSKSA